MECLPPRGIPAAEGAGSHDLCGHPDVTRKRKRGREVAIDGPAKTAEGEVYVIERFNEGSAGQKKRYRNIAEHPLTLAHARGQITSEMHDAGQRYRDLFEAMHRTGRDSTQCLDRSFSGSTPTPWTDQCAAAIRQLQKLEQAMPRRSRLIVRAFCGEGMSAAHAVRAVISIHPNGVMDRLREALMDLVDAMEGQRRHSMRYHLTLS